MWILSHYITLKAAQNCTHNWLYTELQSKMGINSYQKFKGGDYSEFISDYVQKACLNADKLRKEYTIKGITNLRYCNPVTFISDSILKEIFDVDVL